MKKSKLIEMLSEIEGDPDILFWNGYVSDWTDIHPEIAMDTLTKMSFKHYCDVIKAERIHQDQPTDYDIPEEEISVLKEKYKKSFGWEYNQYITLDDINDKRYREKQVFYMQPKLRGKTDYQRGNRMAY